MDWSQLSGIFFGAGLVVAVISALYVGRSRGQSDLIVTQQRIADALRQEMGDEKRRCDDQIATLKAEVHEFKGEVSALRALKVAEIAEAVAVRTKS